MSYEVKLTIGGIVLTDLAIPDKITLGGEQKLVVHELVGGVRVVDAMGRQDAALSWSGRLRGETAVDQANALDALRISGAVVTLTWHSYSYQVVVQQFTPDSFKDKVGAGFTTHFMSPDGSIWTYESLKLGPMGDPEGKMVMVAPPDASRVCPKPIGSDWPTLPDLDNAKALSVPLWYLPPICYMPASGEFTFAGFINFQPVVASAAFPGLHFQLR